MHFSGDTCQQGQHFPLANCPYVLAEKIRRAMRCATVVQKGNDFLSTFSVAIPDMVTPFKNEVTEQTYLRVFQEILLLLLESTVGTRVLGVILRGRQAGQQQLTAASGRTTAQKKIRKQFLKDFLDGF